MTLVSVYDVVRFSLLLRSTLHGRLLTLDTLRLWNAARLVLER
jgi:hypothetical protein